jgi:Lsr2
MAQKVQTLLIDDLDGGEAESTVRFGLDGTEYEIDLSAKNAEALRKALARYVEAGRRRPGSPQQRPGRSGRRASANDVNTTAVREWAKSHGIEVKDRGRVPADVIAKYDKAAGT